MFKTGDKVYLKCTCDMRWGCSGSFPTYSHFFKENGLEHLATRFIRGDSCKSGEYTIVAIGQHSTIFAMHTSFKSLVYVLEHIETKQIYLMGNQYEEIYLMVDKHEEVE